MRTHLGALLATTTVATTTLALAAGASPAADGVDGPSLSVVAGARMYPAWSPATERYAVHPAPDGSVRVEVTGADGVWFDGVPDADGAHTFAAKSPGEEISVFVDDGTGRRSHALYVLPAGFPAMTTASTGAALAPGHVGLTLNRFDGASPRFEAIVDRNGVPVYTRRHFEQGLDLKLAGNGRITVHRPTTTPGRTGLALVELDDQLREVRRHETAGLVHTDGHDSLLLPDGSRWLLAYEPDAATGRIDSVVQHLDPLGRLVWQWSSAPFVGESVTPQDPDYAHANSLDVQPNGDVLVSFRHLSSVFLIASRAHDGYEPGDVIWKLGGRDSDFSFPPLPDGSADVGPCAQHSATMLPSGNVLLFDNGSSSFLGALCVDPADPLGPPRQRATSRVVELALAPPGPGETKGVASVARVYGDTDRFAWFMGSARRLDNGNVLIGWSSSPPWMASETDANGETLWRLGEVRPAPDGKGPYLPYRAALVPARDGFDPEIAVDGPLDGVTVAQGDVVPVSFSCTDRGGSTLRSCDGPAERRLDTSVPGAHAWSVTARDGAGRTTRVTRTYTVTTPPGPAPATQPTAPRPGAPDLALRLPRTRWVGAAELAPASQEVRTRLRPGRTQRASLRVRNVGGTRGRFVLEAPPSLARGGLRVTYVHAGVTRTRAVSGRGWRTPALDPGESIRMSLKVRARDRVTPGRRVLRVVASSPGHRDRVRLVLRVSRKRV